MMRKLWLLVGLLALSLPGLARASSYLDIFSVVHDPIQLILGGDHWYSGPNLQPGASLSSAILSDANLSDADLFGADLSFANLINAILSDADLGSADLSNANLSSADLSNAILSGTNLTRAELGGANLAGAELGGANLSGANLNNADLSDADLFGALGLSGTSGSATYNALTNFSNTGGFDPVAAGWNLVPEPTTGLLLGLGLLGVAARRRV